jgi:hypothetical protein
MSSTHTIDAGLTIKFRLSGMPEDERETANPTVRITYLFTKGCSAHTPRGEYAPIDPPEPAEVELISATLLDGDGLDPTPEQVAEWAQDYLDDAGYDHAISNAVDDHYDVRSDR